jgi:hypothetical protein
MAYSILIADLFLYRLLIQQVNIFLYAGLKDQMEGKSLIYGNSLHHFSIPFTSGLRY